MKKIISILLIFLMIFIPAIASFNQAHAAAFAVLPLGVKLFGTLCTALGLTFVTVAGIKATYDLWAGNLPDVDDYLKKKINDEAVRVYDDVVSYNQGTYTGDISKLGYAKVSGDVVNSVRTFIQSEFSVGSNVKEYIPPTRIEDLPVVYDFLSFNNLGTDLIIQDTRYQIFWALDYAGYSRYRVHIDGEPKNYFIDSYAHPFYSINYNSISRSLDLVVVRQWERYNPVTGEFEKYWDWNRGYPLQENFVVPESRAIIYDGADVLGIPDFWDVPVENGIEMEHEIAFPLVGGNEADFYDADLEYLLEKGYIDVQTAKPIDYGLDLDGGIVNPPVDTPIGEGFLEGLLNWFLDALKAFLNLLIGPLINLISSIYELLIDFWNWLTTVPNVINFPLKERFENKFQISPLINAWSKFQNMKTEKGSPPIIKINLNRIFKASTEQFSQVRSPFDDAETTFIDFSFLEDYHFMGFALIDLFRTLIGAGFIMTTINYVWAKIHPKEVI